MSKGTIIERKGPRGTSYLIKYDGGKDPATGKRRQLYVTVKGGRKKAERELRRVLSQLDQGTHVDPQKMTLGQWGESWLLDYAKPSVSAKTFERYSELLRLHVAPYLGHVPLQKLLSVQIQKLYSKLRSEGRLPAKAKRGAPKGEGPAPLGGLSEQTLLHVHRVLSQCLSEAARQRLIARNPAEDVKAPRPSAGQVADGEEGAGEAIKALDRDQLVKLMQGLREDRLFPISAVAAATGARRGEILALRWQDVDLDRLTLRIERSVEETSGQGADGKAIRFKQPKNRSSKRTIGFDAGLGALLRGHKARQGEVALKLGTRPAADWLLFPASPETPTTPLRPRNVTKRFATLVPRLGFAGLRFHDLRHTHATLLLIGGVPVNAVAQRLGHSTPVITLKVYGHVLRRAEDQAVAVSAGLLEGAL